METLSGAYDEASAAFYRNNEALVASREGQAQLDETLAGLGETISNVKNSLRAEFLPAISEVISAFTDMVNGVDGADEAFAGAITGLVNTAVSMLPLSARQSDSASVGDPGTAASRDSLAPSAVNSPYSFCTS